jgi:hypothetical protein
VVYRVTLVCVGEIAVLRHSEAALKLSRMASEQRRMAKIYDLKKGTLRSYGRELTVLRTGTHGFTERNSRLYGKELTALRKGTHGFTDGYSRSYGRVLTALRTGTHGFTDGYSRLYGRVLTALRKGTHGLTEGYSRSGGCSHPPLVFSEGL